MVKGLYLSGIQYESLADGIGFRATIFVSGCKHNCPGCHSPKTHSFTAGKECTDELIDEIKEEIELRSQMLYGITFSGGDPFYSPEKVIDLIHQLGVENHHIWMYSGFTVEEILQDPKKTELLSYAEVLVDGPFIESERNVSLRFRGSENQRLIDAQKSILLGTAIRWH